MKKIVNNTLNNLLNNFVYIFKRSLYTNSITVIYSVIRFYFLKKPNVLRLVLVTHTIHRV